MKQITNKSLAPKVRTAMTNLTSDEIQTMETIRNNPNVQVSDLDLDTVVVESLIGRKLIQLQTVSARSYLAITFTGRKALFIHTF